MNDATRARARAQHYGPEMYRVIDEVITLVEGEIVSARKLSRVQVTNLLLTILEPLSDIRDRVAEGETETEN